jgi:hypothetical protein
MSLFKQEIDNAYIDKSVLLNEINMAHRDGFIDDELQSTLLGMYKQDLDNIYKIIIFFVFVFLAVWLFVNFSKSDVVEIADDVMKSDETKVMEFNELSDMDVIEVDN